MISKLALAGGAIGAVALLELSKPKPPPGAAVSAAADYIRSNASVAGVTFSVAQGASSRDAFSAMCDALTQHFGNQGAFSSYPTGLSREQLQEVLNLWLGAWEAGCNASSTSTSKAGSFDYAIEQVGQALPTVSYCDLGQCDDPTDDLIHKRTPLGNAVCACRNQRSTLRSEASSPSSSPSSSDSDQWAWDQAVGAVQSGVVNDSTVASDGEIADTFDKVKELASQLDGADGVSNLWQSDSVIDELIAASTWFPRQLFGAVSSALLPVVVIGGVIVGIVLWKELR